MIFTAFLMSSNDILNKCNRTGRTTRTLQVKKKYKIKTANETNPNASYFN